MAFSNSSSSIVFLPPGPVPPLPNSVAAARLPAEPGRARRPERVVVGDGGAGSSLASTNSSPSNERSSSSIIGEGTPPCVWFPAWLSIPA